MEGDNMKKNEMKLQKIYIKKVVNKFYKTCLKETANGGDRICYQKPIDYNFWRADIDRHLKAGFSLKTAVSLVPSVQGVSNESYDLYLKRS